MRLGREQSIGFVEESSRRRRSGSERAPDVPDDVDGVATTDDISSETYASPHGGAVGPRR